MRVSSTDVQVRLDRGSVRASQVIVATGYATPELKPLEGWFQMFNTYVIATPRVAPQVRRLLAM